MTDISKEYYPITKHKIDLFIEKFNIKMNLMIIVLNT